jgi:broad specificity phosphatase PhoE
VLDAARERTEEGPTFTVPELPDTVSVWLVRHGSTEWSESGQHTGTTDVPLTAAGERQAAALRPMLAGISPALVLCSPLQRARRTAELGGLTDFELEPDLVEWNYGEYEGRTTNEIRVDDPGWTLFTHGVPGGETAAQIAERADRVLQRTVEALADGPVVLVGHGHLSRVLGARWIGLPVRGAANLVLGTAAPSVLGAQHGTPVIDRWNLPNPAAEN